MALGLSGICCFLTRYYGIFVWIVVGLYLLALIGLYWKKKEKLFLGKAVRLGVTAFVSGVLSMGYLLMNKVMNGMASGVSRTMWWDDYQTLTNDLIESLLTEFFNIFSLQIPELIEGFPFQIKLFVVAGILIGIGWLVFRNWEAHQKVHGDFNVAKWAFTREMVLVSMAVAYDVIFIGIRYVSSMDSFYFRFLIPTQYHRHSGTGSLPRSRLKSPQYALPPPYQRNYRKATDHRLHPQVPRSSHKRPPKP